MRNGRRSPAEWIESAPPCLLGLIGQLLKGEKVSFKLKSVPKVVFLQAAEFNG